jgi:FMN-dependent oxidoreductase (nitrilotriacetate monooxygenase family)
MTGAKQMRLMAFPLYTGAHAAGWRHPEADTGRLHDVDFHARAAKTAERGKFDAIFFADAQGFRTIVGRDAYSRTDAPRLEPITLLSALSMVTTHLGLIGTLSTSYNEPYSAARRLATLDHISGGRCGWNVVTSTSENEAHNFGRDSHFGHDERYERAAEFVEVCKGLWDSWDDDAFVLDRATGRYFDPDKVHGLNHQGRFFKVSGPMTVARPPQGYPVIVQAGASDAGRKLAAETAEVIFTSHPSLESAQKFYREMKEQVVAAGRHSNDCKIMTAVQPMIADSEDEARATLAQLNDLIHPDLAISMLQLALGNVVDLTSLDPDGPLPPVPVTNANRSTQQRVVEWAERDKLSIAEIAKRVAAARTSKVDAGTPEQIADLLQAWFEGSAADGFVIASAYYPGMLDRFVDGVIPLLQRRGLFRTEYEGRTLRENLGLSRPASRHENRPDLHIEPEIW